MITAPVKLAWLLACTCMLSALALPAQTPSQTPRQTPATSSPPSQADQLSRQFAVPLHDGSVELAELLQGLLAAYELDGSGLDLPAARVDLTGTKGALLLYGSRKLLGDSVRFRRDLAGQQLTVRIDRVRAQQLRRVLRARLAAFAARLAGTDSGGHEYVLSLPPDLDPGRVLAVMIHGVESDAEVFADLQAFLEAAPRCCQTATFEYPNDESIDRTAAALAAKLRALGSQPVALIGHSMGGLVARAVVEDPALDPGNVRTLVLVGTPNAGSNLAGLREALELVDVLRQAGGAGDFAHELLDAVIDHWRDGLGEAGGDLLPGSVFLTRLASRPRRADVDYHLLLGTRSLLRPEQLDLVQQEVQRRLGDGKLAAVLRPRLQSWLGDLDELVDGKGDGAVSVARGSLAGVDTTRLPLDHVGLIRRRGLLGDIERPEPHPVFTRIADWLDPAPQQWLQGRVVDVLGEPLPAAEVWLTHEDEVVQRTATDGEGCYLLPLPRQGGRLRLHAATADRVMASLPCSSGGVQNLTLVDAVALTGSVCDDAGAAVAGADVAVTAPGGFAALVRTDVAGHFACAPVPIGPLRLRAWHGGRAVAEIVDARADRELSLHLQGPVRRPRLLVVPDLPVELRDHTVIDVTADWPLPAAMRHLRLHGDGAAELPVLPFAHELTVAAPGYTARPEAARCGAGASDDVEFRVTKAPASRTTPTPVCGRVTDAQGSGLGGLLLLCCDRQGRRVGITTTAADGRFALKVPLPAAAHCQYGVHVGERPLGGRGDAAGFHWFDELVATEPIELRLLPCGAIAGIARAPNGAALACASIQLPVFHPDVGAATRNAAITATDRQGRLWLSGLASGRYQVRLQALDGQVLATELTVRPGVVTPLGGLQVVPTGGIRGRLLDPKGQPLPSVELRFMPSPLQAGMGEGRAITDRHGRFAVRGLAPGRYAETSGGPTGRDEVDVQAGAVTQHDLRRQR